MNTIAPADVRRLLAETAVALINGEITRAEADKTIRDCRRITRELNQRATLAIKMVRLSRGPKPRNEIP